MPDTATTEGHIFEGTGIDCDGILSLRYVLCLAAHMVWQTRLFKRRVQGKA
jgi:hypothetical protein